MAIGPARMSLMEHLGELRMRLVRVVVCLIAATCVFYLSTGTVVQFLLAPVAEFMPTDGNGDVMLNVLAHSMPFGAHYRGIVDCCSCDCPYHAVADLGVFPASVEAA